MQGLIADHMGILNDQEIYALCQSGQRMLSAFVPKQEGKPSYGLGSFGYDLRLGKRFLVHQPYKARILDPLTDSQDLFEEVVVEKVFYLDPHTQVLAETVETFNMPDDITGIILGKSSYARLGLLVNCTPAEAGWKGILTIELANLSPLPIALHVGQGIAQALFFRGERPERTYTEKEAGGIYQNQRGVTLPQ